MNEDRLLYLIRNQTPEERLLDIIKKSEDKKDSTTIPESTIPELVKKPRTIKKASNKKRISKNIPVLVGSLVLVTLCLTTTLTILLLKEPAAAVSKSGLINEILSTYAFTGVIHGEEPQIIIEDKRYSKIYYLKQKEFLGEIKIQKIEKGMVTLEYKGEALDIQI